MVRSSGKIRKALVLGAGGFIGGHMAKRLKSEGYYVRAADLKAPEYSATAADDFIITDLRDLNAVREIIAPMDGEGFDEIYQFAADMGGAGYIFTGDNDADIMHNSGMINMNLLRALREGAVPSRSRVFYASSACVYPLRNQMDPESPDCRESGAYPADPDSEYGWEKLFSERLYFTYARNHGIPVYVARYHNVFGPEGAWNDGREKVPAAVCRKIARLPSEGGSIEVWGDGEQTRSFLYIDDCIEATRRFIQSDFHGPMNIGSEEMVSINQLVDLVADIADKRVEKDYQLRGPQGVRGRNSNNDLIREKLDWSPTISLRRGLESTYQWIHARARQDAAAPGGV